MSEAASPEAFNYYLLGQHLIRKRTKTDIEAAIPNYEAALQYDPNYAPAHAALGLAWYLLKEGGSTYGTLSLEESLSKALPHLETALELDPQLPEALGNLGLTYDAREQYEQAVSYYERSLAINPSLTEVRNWYSSALGSLGRADDAYREMEHAYELDPLSVLTLTNYLRELMSRRNFDRVEPVLNRLSQIDPGRGAAYTGFARVMQGRVAEGAASVLRAIDLDPESPQRRSQVSWMLFFLGFEDAALAIWPYEDTFPLVSQGTDFEYQLELAQKRFNENPNDPGNLQSLAWAHWHVGQTEQALRLAQRYLDSLGETRRPLDGVNMMFAIDAWRRGDEDTMMARIEPMEADIDQQIASGIDWGFVHEPKAMLSTMRGRTSVALDHLEKAAFQGIMSVERMDFAYEMMGWDEVPEFASLKERHRQYMTAAHDELLETACGPDGFEVWQPSADECGRNESLTFPN